MARIVIIGGGVSGLSAGIYARLHGHEATICERHFVAGGNLTGWQRGEYHIDNCIHWLTGTNPHSPLYKMWEDLGALGDVEIMKAPSLYTCEADGQSLSLSRDIDTLRRDMLAVSPKDKRAIHSLIRAIESMQGLMGIAGKEHDKQSNPLELVGSIPVLIKYYGMTTKDMAEKFESPLIRQFLTSFLSEQFSSLALLFVFAHYCGDNADIPRGSSCGMAQRMTDRFLSLGGTLHLRKAADRILYENGKATAVTFTDGTTLEADYVVVTSDPATLFGKLLDMSMPKPLAKWYQNPNALRFSSYHCAFACDMEELPFQGDLIFPLPQKLRYRLHTDHLILREFSHEKSFAPKGKNILQTLTFCDEESSRRFIRLRKSKAAYNKRKACISKLVTEAITEKFPTMKNKLTCIDTWTPATYHRFVDSEMGSYMSFAFRSHVIPKRVNLKIPQLKNVFMATQWLQAPGGLPIAAESGKRAIEAVLKLERKKKALPAPSV